jgi:hypothetical protein
MKIIESKKPRRAVIYEEYVELLGDINQAICLAQMIFWQSRKRDFKQLLDTENQIRVRNGDIEIEFDIWIYKSGNELAHEIMLGSKWTISRALKELVNKNYLIARRNPKYKYDKTLQYVVNLEKLEADLAKIGYKIPNFEYSIVQNAPSTMQNAPTIPEITTEITSDNIINNSSFEKPNDVISQKKPNKKITKHIILHLQENPSNYDEVNEAIEYYLEEYEANVGVSHPKITDAQWKNIIERLELCQEEYGHDTDTWQDIILSKWFGGKLETDFNLNHFATDGFLENFSMQYM